VVGSRLYVVDLGGSLAVYQEGHRVNTEQLERAIWMLRPYPRGLLAIADQHALQVQLAPLGALRERHKPGVLVNVLGDIDRPVILDDSGGGVILDCDLVIRSRFFTTPGAEPLSADHRGAWCVLGNPDGSRTLL